MLFGGTLQASARQRDPIPGWRRGKGRRSSMSELESLLRQVHLRAAALRSNPHLWRAIRLLAERSLREYAAATPAVRHVVKDRASFALVLTILRTWYLRPGAATAATFKKMLVDFRLGSKSRATDLIAYMRDRKLLLPSEKGRRTLLAPSADLLAYHRASMASGVLALRLLGSRVATEVEMGDDFERAYIIVSAELSRATLAGAGGGLRLTRLFFDRDVGLLLLYALLEAIDEERPTGEGAVSVSGLAGRLGVSRPHILKMLVDAADQGLMVWNPRQRRVRLADELLEEMEVFLAGILAVQELYLERATAWLRATLDR